MRPGIDEQLTGIARILERVVAPAVGDRYAADVLAGVTAVLDGIANGWADVAGFLAWDARETLALVAECAPEFVRKACNELGSSEGSVETDEGCGRQTVGQTH